MSDAGPFAPMPHRLRHHPPFVLPVRAGWVFGTSRGGSFGGCPRAAGMASLVRMRVMFRRMSTTIVCTAVLFGLPAGAVAADDFSKPARTGPTPATVCDILPIFWWCP